MSKPNHPRHNANRALMPRDWGTCLSVPQRDCVASMVPSCGLLPSQWRRRPEGEEWWRVTRSNHRLQHRLNLCSVSARIIRIMNVPNCVRAKKMLHSRAMSRKKRHTKVQPHHTNQIPTSQPLPHPLKPSPAISSLSSGKLCMLFLDELEQLVGIHSITIRIHACYA